jgi:DNA-binding transcriptional LysR family regulator
VPTLTVGSNGAILQAARAGLGVSFVSRDAAAGDLATERLAVIGVESAPGPREWHVLWSTVGPVRPVVEEFLAFVDANASADLR